MSKMYQVSPHDLILIGLDTEDGPEHPHYDPRVKLPVSRTICKMIEKMGHRQSAAIEVKPLKEGLVVTSGRQRVKAARQVSKLPGFDGLKVWVVEIGENNADAVEADAALNAGVVTYTPAHKAATAARLIRVGKSEGEAAAALGLTKKSIQNYLKYDSKVSQEVKNAVEKGVKASYQDPDSETEKFETILVKFGDVVKANLWNLTEEEQAAWLKTYVRRWRVRKMNSLAKANGQEADEKKVQYPPVYGEKSFKVTALDKFADAILLSSPYDVDSPAARAAQDHRAVIGEGLSDDFALGIRFCIGKMMQIFTVSDPEKLEAAIGIELGFSEEQIKAFQQLWKLSQK